MLQFTTPWLLWGVVTAAIPVLIHLFGRRKTRQVAFSSLRFLQALQRDHIRTLKLRQIILLILRTLALILLIMAFAGPRLVPSSHERVAHDTAVLLFDNTVSSGAEVEGEPYLNRLKTAASQLVEQYQIAENYIWVDLLYNQSERVTSGNNTPQNFLERLKVGYSAVDLQRTVSKLRGWLSSQGFGAVDVYLLTDGQSTQYNTFSTTEFGDDWEGSRWSIVTPHQPLQQAGISGVKFSTELLQPGVTAPLQISVTRSDSTSPLSTGISVLRDNEKVGQSLIDWGDRMETTAGFEIPLREPGFFQVEAFLGEDSYTADNHWYLNGRIPERVYVGLISDSPSLRFFLEQALYAMSDQTSQIVVEEGSSSDVGELLVSDLDVIIFIDVVLSPDQQRSVLSWAEEGRGVMVFPGSNYKQVPSSIPGFPRFEQFTELPQGTYQEVTRIDWDHPVMRNVTYKDPDELQLPRVYQFYQFPGGGYTPILEMKNGTALLTESSVGNGILWVWSSAPVLTWNDLPRRGIFLPLLGRSVRYLSGAGRSYQHQLWCGEPITFPVPSDIKSREFTVITPAGQSILVPASGAVVEFDNTELPGQYSLYVDERLLAYFSVNIHPSERSSRRLSRAEWSVLLGEQFGEVYRPTPGEEEVGLASVSQGMPLWRWFILVVLSCIIVEMLLTRHTGKDEQGV